MPTLPLPVSSFVGRDDDIEELTELVAATRLVTLSGPGGIGKTRLALRVAEEVHDAFSDGVWLVELADLDNVGALTERVAHTLRLDRYSGTAMAAVTRALAGGRHLLVLDNCEHLIGHVAQFTADLLAACPDLTVLATSREQLRIPGETLWRVPPLALRPGPDGRSEAEILFTERAKAADPGLVWSETEARTVLRLCVDLEGIPLAIELAAAMTRVLSVRQIHDRLTDRFALLNSGPRTAPVRHQTLRATVEWSYASLSPDAGRLLQQLSVFRGGWIIDLAEQVCDGIGDLLGSTAELVDKSLIQVDGMLGDRFRYRMLDTIRDYARQRLCAEGDEHALRLRHLHSITALAATMYQLASGRGAESRLVLNGWLAVAEGVRRNIPAALSFAAAEGYPEIGLRMLANGRWSVCMHGGYEEYLKAMDRLFEAVSDAPAGLLGTVKAMRGAIELFAGNYTAAAEAVAEAIPLCRSDEGPDGRDGLLMASMVAAVTEVPGGLPLEEAYKLAEQNDDVITMAGVRWGQALVAEHAGRVREAREYYEQMLLVQDYGNDWGPAIAELGLAGLAEDRGDLRAARKHYQTAHALLNDPILPLDYRGDRIRAMIGLGRVALNSGDHVTADQWLRQGLELCKGLGGRGFAAELVETIALLCVRNDDHARAVPLAAAAAAQRERMGTRELPGAGVRSRQVLEPATRVLGQAETNRLWAQGLALPWNRVIDSIVAQTELPLVATAAPVRPPSSLTDRETEIARFVAKGLSNRRIAEELTISQATVARHVSNILAKLAFSSRAQIATWVTENPPGG
ncbi:hypothetical protein GCM10027589_51940 [Actinocorallia lasiicapitis]